MFSIAACNYIFREVADVAGFRAHVREVLDAAGDVDLVVLPELLSLELHTALPGWRTADLTGLAETARFADELEALFADARAKLVPLLEAAAVGEGSEPLRRVVTTLLERLRDNPDLAKLNDLAGALVPPPSWPGSRGSEIPQVTEDAVTAVDGGKDPQAALTDLQTRATDLTK